MPPYQAGTPSFEPNLVFGFAALAGLTWIADLIPAYGGREVLSCDHT